MSRQAELGAHPRIEVVAGILLDDQDRVLIVDRPNARSYEDYWEFPGGKLEAGESSEQALARELKEELGIDVLSCSNFYSLQHEYEDKTVELYFYRVLDYSGEPQGLEGQSLKWVVRQQLHKEKILPADAPVVKALQAV